MNRFFCEWSDRCLPLDDSRTIEIGRHMFSRGRMIGLMGESGSGKTTFLMDLYHRARSSSLRVVLMRHDNLLHGGLTVLETIFYYCQILGRSSVSREAIRDLLQDMGMEDKIDHKIGTPEHPVLSDGEKRRVILAVHLLDTTSDLFLLDEPFTGLDDDNIRRLFGLLLRRTHHATLILSIHQMPPELRPFFDEIWTIENSCLRYCVPDLEDAAITIPPRDPVMMSSHSPTLFSQIYWLLRREHAIASVKTTLLHLLLPVLIILLQNLSIGSFPYHYQKWTQSGQSIDFIQLLISVIIMLFTVSMLPLSLLPDHIQKRSIVLHEISQGLFPKSAWLISAMIAQQSFIILSALLIVSLSLSLIMNPVLLLIYLLIILSEMLFTDNLLWLLSYFFSRSSFLVIQMSVIGILSLSFLGNLPILRPSLSFLRYFSINHLQISILIRTIQSQYPIDPTLLSMLHATNLPLSILLSLSLASWLFFPCLFSLLLLLQK